jgi:hypothetical protein
MSEQPLSAQEGISVLFCTPSGINMAWEREMLTHSVQSEIRHVELNQT